MEKSSLHGVSSPGLLAPPLDTRLYIQFAPRRGLGTWMAGSLVVLLLVVINNFADAAGMRPVVFPHWFHRIRFRCKVCHADLGFKFKAGGNKITMAEIIDGKFCGEIIDGKFCGACHNGEVAWSVENCAMCHSGIPGTPTQIHGSTLQRLVAPVFRPVSKKRPD